MSEGDDASISPPASGRGLGGGPSGFKQRNTERAKALRNTASPPEQRLWRHLRNRQLGGHKFSRQMPIGPYFVDFLCRERMLVIELDGSSHDVRQEKDAQRDAAMIALGYRVLRFQNLDVMQNVEGVLQDILRALVDLPTPNPSRLREGS